MERREFLGSSMALAAAWCWRRGLARAEMADAKPLRETPWHDDDLQVAVVRLLQGVGEARRDRRLQNQGHRHG